MSLLSACAKARPTAATRALRRDRLEGPGIWGKPGRAERSREFPALNAGRAPAGDGRHQAGVGWALGKAGGGAARRAQAARKNTERGKRRPGVAQPAAGVFLAREPETTLAERASRAPRAR